ncbi:hypothetical protein AAFC00_006807 [Neodothiora populina]|uniref:G-patch domain-containing protein n=1 Tax=Neodothiora populina TaxID=2781224 RepID=A0ABR3PB87_9PEZI
MADSDEEYYEVPLKDQRYFGAGIKRKRINFVPSTTTLPASSISSGKTTKSSASERYLAVVFQKSQSESTSPVASSPLPPSVETVETSAVAPEVKEISSLAPTSQQDVVCEICNAPINASTPSTEDHTTSLVHQICLPHSHPPSALDRKRKGISILQSHGWDPDARTGLGAQGEGILHPVKAKEKRDTVGLGHGINNDDDEEVLRKLRKPQRKVERKEVKKLDAGKVRKLDAEQKRKDQKMREMFYANDDIERYLGHAG